MKRQLLVNGKRTELMMCTQGTRGVDAELRLSARRALTIMDRFPVSDDVTYVITDE